MVRRKGRRLRFMAPAQKSGADRKSLVKYVEVCGLTSKGAIISGCVGNKVSLARRGVN